MKNKNYQLSIFESIKSNEILEISTDIVESGIDQLIDNELLKDIPILGTGYKLITFANKITESFYIQKILKFLFQIQDISLEKRIEFIEKLEKEKETKKVGEKLLITLNRLDDSDKAIVIGKLFKATIEGEIILNDFLRLNYIIEKSYYQDLRILKTNVYLNNIDNDIKSYLHQIGLLKQTIKDNKEHEEWVFKQTGKKSFYPPKFEYELNNIGNILINFGL